MRCTGWRSSCSSRPGCCALFGYGGTAHCPSCPSSPSPLHPPRCHTCSAACLPRHSLSTATVPYSMLSIAGGCPGCSCTQRMHGTNPGRKQGGAHTDRKTHGPLEATPLQRCSPENRGRGWLLSGALSPSLSPPESGAPIPGRRSAQVDKGRSSSSPGSTVNCSHVLLCVLLRGGMCTEVH